MNKADNAKNAKIDDLLVKLWRKNLPTLHERLDLLDRAAGEAASGRLDEAKREEARDIAHKLSGSLGMFGYEQGTQIAREIEQILKDADRVGLGRFSSLTVALRRALASAL
ncbi:Hpt domain-containing protein [Granulicella sp. L60]|jgi:HPt (histidine-containing phosphotransfer) domain-containing protein|uniref:Hpt domain-containing protein n=1 Tax=Granulicella sp. L60 TaxID=1641866 RepID=UPI00131DA75A|nr:Hpt domain-containing protein [Granulicella sp. L60]